MPPGTLGPWGGHYFTKHETAPSGNTEATQGMEAIDAATNVLFTANQQADSLTATAISNGSLLQSTWLGDATAANWVPTGLALDLKDHLLAVSMNSETSARDGVILLVSESNLSTAGTIAISGGSFKPFVPFDIVWDPITDRLFAENGSFLTGNGAVLEANPVAQTQTTIFACGTNPCSSGGLTIVPQFGELVQSDGNGSGVVVYNTTTPSSFKAISTVPFLTTFTVGGVWDPKYGLFFVGNFSGKRSPLPAFNITTDTFPLYSTQGSPPYTSSLAYDAATATVVITDENSSAEIYVENATTFAVVGHSNSTADYDFANALIDPNGDLAVTGGSGNNTSQVFPLPSLGSHRVIASFPYYSSLIGTNPSLGLAFQATELPFGVQAVEESSNTVVWSYHSLSTFASSVGFALDNARGLLFAAERPLGGSEGVQEFNQSTGIPGLSLSLAAGDSIASIAVDPNSTRLYVALNSVTQGDLVAVYNYHAGFVLVGNALTPGTLPCVLSADPADGHAFGSNCANPGNVTEVNGASATLVRVYHTGAVPYGVAFAAAGVAYTANVGSRNLSVLNLTSGAVLGAISTSGTFLPIWLAADPVDHLLFVASEANDSIEVVSTTSETYLTSVGPVSPVYGITFEASSGTLVGQEWAASSLVSLARVATPSAPTLSPLTVENGTLVASWSVPTSPLSITGYNVSIASSASGPWTLSPPTTSTTASLTGLVDGQTYYVEVAAQSPAGTGPVSSVRSAVPIGVPYPPTSVAAAGSDANSINATWAAPASTDGSAVTNYTVEYQASGATTWTSVSAGAALRATITGLAPSTSYSVRVVAWNAAGPSSPSVSATATTSATQHTHSGGGGGAFSSPYVWAGVGAVVVVALLAIAFLLLRRRRSPGSGAPPAGALQQPGSSLPPWSEAEPSTGPSPPPGAR